MKLRVRIGQPEGCVLADRARHWAFVSSINACADTATIGQSTDAAAVHRRRPGTPEATANRQLGGVAPHLVVG